MQLVDAELGFELLSSLSSVVGSTWQLSLEESDPRGLGQSGESKLVIEIEALICQCQGRK